MRILLITIAFFIVATVIKIDLTKGTVPLAAFVPNEQQCEQESSNEQYSLKAISVITTEGDTVRSLFAAYPSELEISFPERLAHFYKLNPHLQKQSLVSGELIKIPIYKLSSNEQCLK